MASLDAVHSSLTLAGQHIKHRVLVQKSNAALL